MAAKVSMVICDNKSPDYKPKGLTEVLETVIRDLRGLCFEVDVKPKPENLNPVHKDTEHIKLSEEFPECQPIIQEALNLGKNQSGDCTDALLDHLEMLQGFHKRIMIKVSTTLDNLKSLFDPDDYEFVITQRMEAEDEPEEVGGEKPDPAEAELEEESSEAEASSSQKIKKEVSKKTPKRSTKKRKLSSLQPESSKKANTTDYPILLVDRMIIGPNGTTIRKKDYEGLCAKGPFAAMRKLCDIIFGDEILAKHSLTGNQSPAFRGRERPAKQQLDPLKTADITHLICSKFGITQQLARSTITSKCADSSKKMKRLLAKTVT